MTNKIAEFIAEIESVLLQIFLVELQTSQVKNNRKSGSSTKNFEWNTAPFPVAHVAVMATNYVYIVE